MLAKTKSPMSVISQKTKNHVVPVAENIDQPALKMQRTGDFADIETDHENAVPSLSETDLVPLKAIFNAKAQKNKYLRGQMCKDVNWVYTKALAINPDGTNQYISQRDEAPEVIQAVLDPIVQQVVSVDENAAPVSIESFFQEVEATAECPCYRRIQVTLNGQGKKIPSGEKNDMSPEQIGVDRGSGNTFSLSVKHVARLYVVDFDTKDLDGCKLRDYLDSLGAACVETKKGFHYYLLVNDMIAYTQQQKIYIDDRYEVDLLKTNNVWETCDRTVTGKLVEVDWSDLQQFFDIPKMTSAKTHKKTAKTRPKEPVITVSTSKVYSSERNEKRSVAQCIAAAETGSAHWQESFNDPQRLVKLYFDVDYTLPDDEVDIEQTYEKFRQALRRRTRRPLRAP